MTLGRHNLFLIAFAFASFSLSAYFNPEEICDSLPVQEMNQTCADSSSAGISQSMHRSQQPVPDQDQIHKKQKLASFAGKNRRRTCDFIPITEIITISFQVSDADRHIQNSRTTTASPSLQIILCISLTWFSARLHTPALNIWDSAELFPESCSAFNLRGRFHSVLIQIEF